MTDPVFRKLEIVGTSTVSIEDAIARGVAATATAGETVDWFEVLETRGAVREGKVHQYQVVLKVGVRVRA